MLMKTVLLACCAAGLATGCGPPSDCCGRRTNVARATAYTTTLPLPDGGTPTQVRVNVAASGNTTLTFINDGHEIVQGFDALPANPFAP